MSFPTVKLADVAPAKALKRKVTDTSELVWHLNLDQVESQTGRVLKEMIAPISEAGNSTHWFDERHVLYSKLRPYLNKVVLPEKEGIATTELVPMLPDPERLDRKYLAHYLRSEGFVSWVSSQVAGAKMPRVAMKVFWDHEIPLPPLAEQKRIAAILDKADALRRKRQQAIELADQFMHSVFLDMFGDPVTNSKGWNELPLSEGVASIESGWSANGDSAPASGEQLGVLKISSVTSGVFQAAENKAVEVSSVPANKKLLKPRAGDLIFSRANTRELVAATALVDKDYDNLFLPDKLWRIKTNEKLLSEYLHYLLKHPKMRDRLTSQATGTSGSMLNISKKKFEETLAFFPLVSEQEKFAKIFFHVNKMHELNRKKAEGIEGLFLSLSQRAFSGQL
ncbi:restriction endonuclease subunit S [Oceanimonas sp. CHS3-5]|uniref:restriction endonuclease subunit S n=1 Tax=Oceanimonas sp. CHS3-5 TaxID=3068186 RepID=UPI0027400B21|nr:restriction endonuclease subunit S [Oceanimonas sp. CHS3-5]MDP5293554.1 restriction endonuclease subunit S [Oceanimonas sp. CHS3-5]